jgi:hypothetical protein
VDDPKYFRVAADDDYTRDDESNDEEESFGSPAIRISDDRTSLEIRIVVEFAWERKKTKDLYVIV